MSTLFAVSGQNTLIRPTDIVGHSNITTISHLNGVTYFAKTATNQQEIYRLTSGATERVGIIPGMLPVKSITVFNRQIYFIHDNSVKRVADNPATIERIAGRAGTTANAIREPFYGTINSFGTLEHITVDLTENRILFTDSQHKMIYSLDQEGIVRCLLTGTVEYTGTIRQTDTSSRDIGTIADVCGIDAAIDGTIYCSARSSSMILALKKQFDAQGNVFYLCSTLLGLRQGTGTSQNRETAVYAATTTPNTVRVNSLNQVFFAEGASGIKRIDPEEYRVYAKGQSGAIRYAPLQLIGNITTEGYVENLAEWKDAISTELYCDSGVADMEGNLYFCDPKIGALYQLDLNGKLKILNPSNPIEKLSYVTLCRNTVLYAVTQGGVWASYSLITNTFTTLSFTMPNLKAVSSHPAGYLIACDSLQLKWANETAATWTWANGPSVPAAPTAMLLDGKNSLWVACVDNKLYQYTVTLTMSGLSISTTPTTYGNGSVDAWPFQEGAIASTPIGLCRGIAYHPIDACIYVSTSKRVCRITPYDSSPTIKTFIGTINPGLAIDGAYSAASSIKEPTGIVADYQGNLYIMDQQARNDAGTINSTILIKAPNKLFMRNDYVYCLAGTGKAGYAGDNSPAPLANFDVPRGLAFDTANTIYIADTNNHCVRKVDAVTEQVTCIAGIPQQAGSIFNSNPLLLQLNSPQSVAVSQTGSIYIASASRIIRLTKSGTTYVASIFAGNGTFGAPTLNGLARNSPLGDIRHIIVDNRSNLYLSDSHYQKIYKIDTFGRITEVASLVRPGVEGPFELALDPTQSFLYVTFKGEGMVYKINLATSATDVFVSGLNSPVGLCCGPTGDLYVTDQMVHKIKKITPGGVVTDFLGTGEVEFNDAITPIAGVRDGMYRLQARTFKPNRLAINALGQLIFTEWENYRIRMVPTATSICEFPCRYIKWDSGSSGQPTIDFFKLYYGDFDPALYKQRNGDLVSFDDNFVRAHYINHGRFEDRDCLPFIDYPSDGVIPTTISSLRYLRIKGGSNCIGMKIFLYNEQRQIISTRVVSNRCQTTNGEVLLLTSPASDCQFVPTPIYTRNVCGVPQISSIEIRIPEVFLLRETIDTSYSSSTVLSKMERYLKITKSGITQTISNTPYTYTLPYPSPRLANSKDLANAVRLGAQWSSAGWAYSESGGIEAYTTSQVNSTGGIQRTVNRSTETSALLSVYGYKVDLPNYTTTNFYTPTSTEILPARQSLPISKILSKIVIVTKEDNEPITINFNETVDTTSSKIIVFGENLGTQSSATLANKEILGILVYRNARSLPQDIEGVYIGLIGTTDSGQRSTVAKKVIRMTNPENTMFEFIDFRSSLKGIGCQSIESIYKTAFTYDIIRYIRIKRVGDATLNLAEIVVISAESGKNLALGRSLYSSGGTAITTITTGVTQKTSWNSYSTWDNWVELDLGRGYILEQIQIYTPLFMNSPYTVEAYTEQRDPVPLPDDSANPLSNLVKTIRIQHAGYNYTAILGGTEPAESKLTLSRIEAYPLFNSSSNILGSAAVTPSGAAGVLSGTTYESQGTGRTEQVAITLPSPAQLTHISVRNRGDINSTAAGDYYYGRQTFGASVVAENAVGQPIQSFELTGNHLNSNQIEALPMMKGLPGVQYVTVSLPNGYLHFSKLEVYDFRGVNIAVNTGVPDIEKVLISCRSILPDGSYGIDSKLTNPITGPSEPSSTRLYHSYGNINSNEYYELDLRFPREISCIILYNRNGLNERLNGASLTLTSPMDGGTTRIRQPLRTYTLNSDLVQIFWVGTYFPFLCTLPILSSRIGVSGVRYIKLQNTEPNKFLTFDQIQVIDVNGINRAASLTNAKGYRSSTSSGTEILELDLGQDIELDYVVFYRNVNGHDNIKFLRAECDALGETYTNGDCSNAERLAGIYTLQVLDSNRTIINGTHTTNTLIRQSFDFRQEAFARNSLRFRYLRIEGPGMILTRTSQGVEMGLQSCKLYDIYGRNVCIGKYATAQNINGLVPQGIQNPLLDTNSFCTLYADPGSFWQVDLGQEYSIAEIELKFTADTNTLNTPVILYNNDFAPVKRLILGKKATDTPFRFGPNDPAVEYALNPAPELQQNSLIQYTVSSTDRGVLARFIHLDGNGTDQLSLGQVIVVDCNGLNVALGKPTYASAAASGEPMNLVNGIGQDNYISSAAQGAYWEVDLGAEYKICAIILVRAAGVGVVRGNRHLRGVFPSSCFSFTISSLNTTRHTISVDSAGPQEVYPRTDLGKRCRYLRILKPFEAGYNWSNLLIFSRVVVSDSFGRNVATEKYARTIQNEIKPSIVSRIYKSTDWFYHGVTWYSSDNNPNYKGFMWVDIDLGAEYLVTDFSIYAAQYLTHQTEIFSSSQLPTRVRYIIYKNYKASSSDPYIQTRGIRAYDMNGVNVAKGKPARVYSWWDQPDYNYFSMPRITDESMVLYHSGEYTRDEFIEIDLQGEFDIKQLVFYNRDNQWSYRATGAEILLCDSSVNAIARRTLNADYEQWFNFAELKEKNLAGNLRILTRDSYQRLTTVERNSDHSLTWNLLQQVGKVTTALTCPVNTVPEGTQCRETCLDGEVENGGRCYQGCPSGTIVNTSNITQCLGCRAGTSVVNDTQCIPDCDTGFEPISMTTCRTACSTDTDGRPAGIVADTNVCETLTYDTNSSRIQIVNSLTDLFMQRISFFSFINDITRANSIWGGLYMLTSTYTAESSAGRARRIYTRATETRTRGAIESKATPTARPSREKRLVDKINMPSASTAPAGYTVLTVRTIGGPVTRSYQDIYDWTSGAKTNFKQFTNNPEYVIGRTFAETTDFLGNGTRLAITRLPTIPEPEAATCPTGYTENPATTGAANICKLQQPPSTVEQSGRYYYSCPSGMAPDSADPSICRTVCPVGFTAENNTTCVASCPSGYTPYILNGTRKCIRCNTAQDQDGQNVTFDTNILTGTSIPANTIIAKQQRFFNARCYKQRYSDIANYSDDDAWNHYHTYGYFERRIPGCDEVCITDTPADTSTEYDVYRVAYGENYCPNYTPGVCWSGWRWRPVPKFFAWAPVNTNKMSITRTLGYMGTVTKFIYAFTNIAETQLDYNSYTNQNMWEGDNDDDNQITDSSRYTSVGGTAGRYRFLRKRNRALPIYTVPATTTVRATSTRTTSSRSSVVIQYSAKI